MALDPVCGMTIAEHDAQAVRQVGGAAIYFCSAACARQFDAEPERYATHLGGAARSPAWAQTLLRPFAFGLLAVLGLLAFYLGTITLAQGWEHALQQLAEDRAFIGAIVLGFGAQVGLYTRLRSLHSHAAVGGVAASTGASSATMLACCAHHLADLLPLVGVAGAAALLNTYKGPMLWLSIAMNVAGVVYLLRKLRQQRSVGCRVSVEPGAMVP